MLREDNTGAIFLTNNDVMSQRTKHIDTRHHFVREMISNGEITVKYIRSERNPADLMTKNLGTEKFVTFGEMILSGRFLIS